MKIGTEALSHAVDLAPWLCRGRSQTNSPGPIFSRRYLRAFFSLSEFRQLDVPSKIEKPQHGNSVPKECTHLFLLAPVAFESLVKCSYHYKRTRRFFIVAHVLGLFFL